MEIREKEESKRLFTRTRLVDYLFLGILSVYGLYLIRGIFGSGLFYNYDVSQHLVESVYVATVLLPKYHQLIGWNPYFYLGWPQGQFNPPASYLIYSILYYSLSWGFSSITIFKIMLAGFFIFPAFSIYYAAKWFGMSRLTGFVGGFIAIGTAGGFETAGPLDYTYYGMYEFSTAIALIPLILAIYHQSFVRKSRQLLLLTGFLVALDFLLHTLAGVFLVVVLVIYTMAEFVRSGVFESNRRKNLLGTVLKFVVVMLIVAGICSFWLIPAYAGKSFYVDQSYLVLELGNYATTFNNFHLGYIFGEQSSQLITNILHPTNPTITQMLYSSTQTILPSTGMTFYQFLLMLTIIGAVAALIRKKSRFPLIVMLLTIGIFAFISLGPKFYESLWNDPTFQLLDLRPARAASVIRIFLCLFAGAAIGETLSLVSTGVARLNRRKIGILLKVAAVVVIVLVGITLAVNSYALMTQLPLGSTTNNLPAAQDITPLFTWIKDNVPNNTRVGFEEYPGNLQHLFAVTPLLTGVEDVGSGYGFWWQGADASNYVSSLLSNANMYTGPELYSTFAGLNVGYLVVWTSNAQYGLSAWPGYFTLVKQIGPFSIYKLDRFSASYAAVSSGSGNASVTNFQPESITVHLQNVTSGSDVLIRVAYYTNWVAQTSSGAQVTVYPIWTNLPLDAVTYMEIQAPKGGTYNVTLTYSQTQDDTIGNIVSIFSLMIFLVCSIFVALTTRTRYPVAEYLVDEVRKPSGIVRSTRASSASENKANPNPGSDSNPEP